MEQSQPDNSLTMVDLQTIQWQREQPNHSQQQDERSLAAIEDTHSRCVSMASSSIHPASSAIAAPNPNSLLDAPSYNFESIVPCAYRSDRRQTIRAQTTVLLVATTLLLCKTAMATCCANASVLHHDKFRNGRAHVAMFVTRNNTYRHWVNINPSMSIQRKTPQQRRSNYNIDTTWSNAVRHKSELNESRFGVRKRVQTVLDKAKKRTGIDNSSAATDRLSSLENRENPFVQSGLNIVAEAASIGALDPVVIDENGNVDVALDYTSSKDAGGIKPSEENYDYPAIMARLSDDITRATAVNGVKQTSESSPNAPSIISSTALYQPEDDFVLKQKSDVEPNSDLTQNTNTRAEKGTPREKVSSVASSSLPQPLPFTLPTLSAEQSRRVTNGERVQFQDDMGRAGSGFVVWDVKAPASVVWDCLLDFQSYPQTIPTVREVVMYTNTHLKEDYRAEKPLDFEDGTVAICKHGVPSVTRAQFSLSKFRLKIAAVHKYRPHPSGDYMIFTLDPASTNMVLKYAKGIWYTESNPNGKEGHTRVWLLCELRVSRLLPQWIVDYAAARAMPRATTWLKPQTEAAAMLWLKDEIKGKDT